MNVDTSLYFCSGRNKNLTYLINIHMTGRQGGRLAVRQGGRLEVRQGGRLAADRLVSCCFKISVLLFSVVSVR